MSMKKQTINKSIWSKLDKETFNLLDLYCKISKSSKSDLIRNAISSLFSGEFNYERLKETAKETNTQKELTKFKRKQLKYTSEF